MTRSLTRVGFTGTSKGTTYAQRVELRRLCDALPRPLEVHHGDCLEADEDFHACFGPDVKIVVHPPSNPRMRAFLRGDVNMLEDDYIARNHYIVDQVEWVFATPREQGEVVRSGTWSTVRYARKRRMSHTIIYPDGKIFTETWPETARQGRLL